MCAILFEMFLILRRIQRDITVNAIGFCVKCPWTLSNFSENWIFSMVFESLKYQFSWKFFQWEAICTMLLGRHTDKVRLIVAFRNAANAPKHHSYVSTLHSGTSIRSYVYFPLMCNAWEAFLFDEQYNFKHLCLMLWYCDMMNLCWGGRGNVRTIIQWVEDASSYRQVFRESRNYVSHIKAYAESALLSETKSCHLLQRFCILIKWKRYSFELYWLTYPSEKYLLFFFLLLYH